MKTPHRLLFPAFLLLLLTAFSAKAAPASFLMREGQARVTEINPSKLPPGTPPKLYAAVLSGSTFDLFVRNLPAGSLTIELGFVDTQSSGPGQHAFA